MLVKVAFFDSYINENELRKAMNFNLKILKKELCFSSQIRLRKNYDRVFTFNIKDFKTNSRDFSYGVLYTFDMSEEDKEWFDIILTAPEYHVRKESVSIFKTDIANFINGIYEVIGKSDNCYIYSAMPNTVYKSKYKNRHTKVSFHKYLFINIIQY